MNHDPELEYAQSQGNRRDIIGTLIIAFCFGVAVLIDFAENIKRKVWR